MDQWQKLIHVLVEIWTEEDIKNGKWQETYDEIKHSEDFGGDNAYGAKDPNAAA